MPGHAHAAIKAMHFRHERLKSTNITAAEEFLLAEQDDPSKYLSVQWFFDNAINPCINSTFVFTEHVINAVKNIHQPIQPLEIYHLGGDEVAKGAWVNSSACQEFLGSSNVDTHFIQQHFVTKVASQIDSHGLSAAAWEDGLMSHEEPYNTSVLSVHKE